MGWISSRELNFSWTSKSWQLRLDNLMCLLSYLFLFLSFYILKILAPLFHDYWSIQLKKIKHVWLWNGLRALNWTTALALFLKFRALNNKHEVRETRQFQLGDKSVDTLRYAFLIQCNLYITCKLYCPPDDLQLCKT